jgi:hypothetical protein
MRDYELIAIAAFKLSETAKRVRALAKSAASPALRWELQAVAKRLEEQERSVRTLVAAASEPDRGTLQPAKRRASS